MTFYLEQQKSDENIIRRFFAVKLRLLVSRNHSDFVLNNNRAHTAIE